MMYPWDAMKTSFRVVFHADEVKDQKRSGGLEGCDTEQTTYLDIGSHRPADTGLAI